MVEKNKESYKFLPFSEMKTFPVKAVIKNKLNKGWYRAYALLMVAFFFCK